jgi:hypothetical protein
MSIKNVKVSLPDSLISEIAQKLGIKDKRRIPSELDFYAIGASDTLKASSKGKALPFNNIRVSVIA